jgi:hypothetical protein
MSEFVPPSLQEVWDWKKKAEDSTRGMDREELLRFYREQARAAEKKLDVQLPTMPGHANARSRP